MENNNSVTEPKTPLKNKKSRRFIPSFWRSKQRRNRVLAAYAFITPAYLLFFVFLFIPVVWAFYLSFTDYSIFSPGEFIGFENYTRLIGNSDFKQALWNTSYYALMVIPLNIVISLALALLVNIRLKGMALFRASYYIPVVTSIIAASMIWMWLYDSNNGLINFVLVKL